MNIFIKNLLTIAISQTIMWIISVIISNPTFVDFSWCFCHFLLALSFISDGFITFNFLEMPFDHIIILLFVFIWLLRLGGFILVNRIFTKHFDERYKMLLKKSQFNHMLFFFFQFQMQGFLTQITSFSLFFGLFSEFNKNQRNLKIISWILCIIGIIGEAIADSQLQEYKNKKRMINDTKKEIFKEGLFKKSRHPNLFFELIFWLGISCYGFSSSSFFSLSSFLSPLALWLIMNFLTIPLTEKHMKVTRENYIDVIKQTNKFLPF